MIVDYYQDGYATFTNSERDFVYVYPAILDNGKWVKTSFDKIEVLNETAVNKSQGLVKTVCSDLKQEHAEKINQMVNKLTNGKNKGPRPNMNDSDEIDSEENGRPQCIQQ